MPAARPLSTADEAAVNAMALDDTKRACRNDLLLAILMVAAGLGDDRRCAECSFCSHSPQWRRRRRPLQSSASIRRRTTRTGGIRSPAASVRPRRRPSPPAPTPRRRPGRPAGAAACSGGKDGAADQPEIIALHRTSTFLNCQGSDVSMSSGNSPGRSRQRRPVGVVALHRAEIRPLDFEAAAEIHLVGLDDAGRRDFPAPTPCRPAPPRTPACRWRSGRARARASPRSRAASRTSRRSCRGRRAARRARRCRPRSRSRRGCATSAASCRSAPNISCSDSTASLAG